MNEDQASTCPRMTKNTNVTHKTIKKIQLSISKQTKDYYQLSILTYDNLPYPAAIVENMEIPCYDLFLNTILLYRYEGITTIQ
jgi:hypothetical protein